MRYRVFFSKGWNFQSMDELLSGNGDIMDVHCVTITLLLALVVELRVDDGKWKGACCVP